MNVIECHGLAKRYRRAWALRDCSLVIPEGHVVALVGPNGAGKTTLLNLAAGLLRPSAGEITVLGGQRPGSDAARVGIGFVAQDAPLYGHLPAGDMLRLAERLNVTWAYDRALGRLADLGIPLDRRGACLVQRSARPARADHSPGQAAQASHPGRASGQPRPARPARLHGINDGEVAQEGLSVVFSSHVVAELERIADYLVVLNGGRLQLAGNVDDLLAVHRILTGPGSEAGLETRRLAVVHARHAGAQAQLLVRTSAPGAPAPPGWQSDPASLEDLVLGYLRDPSARMLPGPAMAAPAGGSAGTP